MECSVSGEEGGVLLPASCHLSGTKPTTLGIDGFVGTTLVVAQVSIMAPNNMGPEGLAAERGSQRDEDTAETQWPSKPRWWWGTPPPSTQQECAAWTTTTAAC